MNVRTRPIIILAAVFLLITTVVVLPRIIEARRLKDLSANKSLAATPVLTSNTNQDQKTSVTVGASVRNDTSMPLRDMKQAKVGKKVEHEANENPKVPTNSRVVHSSIRQR